MVFAQEGSRSLFFKDAGKFGAVSSDSGDFNNRKMSRNLKFEEFPTWKWSNNLLKYVLICSSLLFYIFLCFLFLSMESVLTITTKFCILIFLLFNIFQIVFAWFCSLLVMLSGDAEVNPAPKIKDKDCLSICHWNLNSISSYGYSKLFFLHSYNSLKNLILYETYLYSNTPLDDENLETSGYALVRSDHPTTAKRRGVCLDYKNNLPLRVLNIGYLNRCLTFELKIGDKICNFVVLYRSPSQSQDELETFSDNFEMTLDILAQKIRF